VIIFQLSQSAIKMKMTQVFILILVLLNQGTAQKSMSFVSSFSGFVQPIYKVEISNSKIQANQFLINRFRIGLESKFSDWIKSEIEFDPLDKNLVKDAILNFYLFQNFSLSFGRQKMPFSKERLTSVKEIQYFERTKVVKEFDDHAYAGRDIGLIFSFKHKIKKIKFDLSFGVFNGNKGDLNGDYNNFKTLLQRIELSDNNFSLGFNSAQKFDSLSSKYFVANGFDFEIELIDNLSFTSEFLIGRKNSNTLIGGEYFAFEYKLNEFIFGIRYSQYFSDIKKLAIEFYETKVDYKPSKKIKISINWLGENKSTRFENRIIFGAYYVL